MQDAHNSGFGFAPGGSRGLTGKVVHTQDDLDVDESAAQGNEGMGLGADDRSIVLFLMYMW